MKNNTFSKSLFLILVSLLSASFSQATTMLIDSSMRVNPSYTIKYDRTTLGGRRFYDHSGDPGTFGDYLGTILLKLKNGALLDYTVRGSEADAARDVQSKMQDVHDAENGTVALWIDGHAYGAECVKKLLYVTIDDTNHIGSWEVVFKTIPSVRQCQDLGWRGGTNIGTVSIGDTGLYSGSHQTKINIRTSVNVRVRITH